MIDVVYPLGNGSCWGNNEIRYSIRSVCKYFIDLGRIFIVGEKPDFLDWSNTRLVHIPQEDIYLDDKDANLILKVIRACQSGVSEKFVRMSDDQVFLKPISVKDMKPYYLYDLKFRTDYRNRWAKRLENTKNILLSENKSTYNYESHYPMVYDRDSFVRVMKRERVTINTYYFNSVLEKHEKIPENYKLTVEEPLDRIDDRVFYSVFLGYNDRGIRTGVLKEILQRFFPEKCFFEI